MILLKYLSNFNETEAKRSVASHALKKIRGIGKNPKVSGNNQVEENLFEKTKVRWKYPRRRKTSTNFLGKKSISEKQTRNTINNIKKT